ncbi:MAG: hypothetical protein N838_04580 [Thiohalocapsa sp. PB-PSB1]|jgi:uncharacterized protein (DUF58 family)|nr:MAG: hypothetical protein N838_04580 [Thiohalocapsa sp. PB-PSB1]
MHRADLENADIRVDTDDLIALRARADRIKPARPMPARSALAGAHRSRFRGRGMDYRESRCYQAGDDIRNMDWRITARAGHAHVKLFDEERERPVVVVADFGPSMFFASTGAFKSVIAARLAALIGWATIAHGDRIGALIFNGGHQELQPTGGRRGQMRLIRALAQAGDPAPALGLVRGQSRKSDPDMPGKRVSAPTFSTPAPSTSASSAPASSDNDAATDTSCLTQALARLRRVARPGSLVFLLSDFYTLDQDSERYLARLARNNDLTAFQIVDPLEVDPPPPGRYAITDGVRGGFIDTAGRVGRERYAAHFARHHERVQEITGRCGIALLRCGTDQDPAERLAAAMAARTRRSGAGGYFDDGQAVRGNARLETQTAGRPRWLT